MGIKNLNNLLRKNCPLVFEEIHLSEFSFSKVAVDISLFLCKFKSITGEKWLLSFVNLISCLRKNNIHCVFIYDNGAPIEKNLEREERVKQRDKLELKVEDLEKCLENYYLSGCIDPKLIEIYNRVNNDNKDSSYIFTKSDIQSVDDKIQKMRRYIINISPEDFILTRKLFDTLKVPYYVAPLEAETMCSDLCKRGLVDAVLSEDTDVLAYGAPIFLTKIDTFKNTCVKISYDKVLSSLSLNKSEFLDLCIMCGTDYNKNIPKIGCETSYKYILKYRSIEEIKKNMPHLDISILNHIRTRELFISYEKYNISNIPYCGKPDLESLNVLLSDNNLFVSFNYFNHKNTIIFEDKETSNCEESEESEEKSDELTNDKENNDDKENNYEDMEIDMEVEMEIEE